MKKMKLINFTTADHQQLISDLVTRNTLKNTSMATQTPSVQQSTATQTPTIQQHIQTQTMNGDDADDDNVGDAPQENLTKNASTNTTDNQMSASINNYAALLENGLQALTEHGFKWGANMKLRGSAIPVMSVIESLAANALFTKDKRILTIVNQVKGPVIAGAIGTPPSKPTSKRISKPSIKKQESEEGEAGTSKQQKKKIRLSAPFKVK
jgi:hypothetical protein